MSQQTDEELLDVRVDRMGQKLGQCFHALERELTWMHWRWKQHRILFGNDSKVDLLNQSASFFFYLVHRVFFEDTLLAIARLTDKVNAGGHVALTVQQLPLLVDDRIRAEVTALTDTAIAAAKFAVVWRNNHIAHRNLNLALDDNQRKVPEAKQEDVESALAALRKRCHCYLTPRVRRFFREKTWRWH
ncbi:MAG: hypothetical protein ACRD4C_06605 [Candidatus Acidiferrales bacterium]